MFADAESRSTIAANNIRWPLPIKSALRTITTFAVERLVSASGLALEQLWRLLADNKEDGLIMLQIRL